jgi:hypothetical protein
MTIQLEDSSIRNHEASIMIKGCQHLRIMTAVAMTRDMALLSRVCVKGGPSMLQKQYGTRFFYLFQYS